MLPFHILSQCALGWKKPTKAKKRKKTTQQSRGVHKIGQIWHQDHSSICFQGEFEKGQKLPFCCHSLYSIAPCLIFNPSDHLRHCSQSHDTAIVASPEEGMVQQYFFY